MGTGFWPLVSMGAILGGTMRVPFTSVVFALELTHDFQVTLPLFIAVSVAFAVTVLTLKRSILTEKISRRGYHLSREYTTDPFEIVFVREAMRKRPVVVFPQGCPVEEMRRLSKGLPQRLYPVLDQDGVVQGVIRQRDLADELVIQQVPVVARPRETLRSVQERMAETGLTRLPVVDDTGRLLGLITLTDLLRAAARNLASEKRQERILTMPVIRPHAPQPVPREGRARRERGAQT
jgi:CBS domain-containing protein